MTDLTTTQVKLGDLKAFVISLLGFGVFYGTFFAQSFTSGNLLAPSDSLDFGVAAYLARPQLWTEGMYSGFPSAADPQSLVWYPLLRLFKVLHVDWNVFLIAAYVITSATAFLLVRRITRSTLAGVFGGLVCGFSAFSIGYITNFNQLHASAWIPLAFYGLVLIRDGQTRAGAAITALAVAMSWLAGHPQVCVYATYLAALVTVGQLAFERPRWRVVQSQVGWTAVGLGAGLLMASVILLPMYELGQLSPRAEASWELYGSSPLPARELLTMAMPFAFGGFWTPAGGVPYVGASYDSAYLGVLPLALAALAPCIAANRQQAIVWLAAAAFELLLSLGTASPAGWAYYHFPGVAGFQAPVRHLFLVALCMSVAASIGFAELLRTRALRAWLVTAIVTLAGVTGTAFVILIVRGGVWDTLKSANASYTWWALWWPMLVAAVFVLVAVAGRLLQDTRAAGLAFGIVLLVCHAAELTTFHYFLPGRRFVYAEVSRSEAEPRPEVTALRQMLAAQGQRILAVEGSRDGFLRPNLTRAWDVPAATGSGSLNIERYTDLLGIGSAGEVAANTLSDENLGPDLFSIAYVLMGEKSELATQLLQSSRWQKVDTLRYTINEPDTYAALFRNTRAQARAWCTPEVRVVNRGDDLAAIRSGRLPSGDVFDPRRTTIVGPGVLPNWQNSDTPPRSVAVDSRARRYLIETSAPCVLVFSEVYYPWWRASIDGAEVPVFRVNYTMVATVVPAGSHTVRLWLRPLTVWAGMLGSTLGTVICIGLLGSAWRQGRRRSVPQQKGA